MIHYFNPGHEAAILNSSKFYMLPANLQIMQEDLAFLLAWSADEEDCILVYNNLPRKFKSALKDKLKLPINVISWSSIASHRKQVENKEVCFWGISPQAIHLFENINKENELNLSIPTWHEELKEISSRQTSKRCLEYIIEQNPYFSSDIVPQFFTSLSAIEDYISQNSQTQYLAKAPFSSSGRGLLWLPMGELTRTERQILSGHIKKQGSVSLEKALNRTLDFAMEFTSKNKQVQFEGLSLFKTNNKGVYLGNYIGSQTRIEDKINRYINSTLLDNVKANLIRFIEDIISPYYDGYLGVDMMVYENQGEYFLHPCLEINVRNNMGVIALHISQKSVSESSEGFFCIDFSANEEEIYKRDLEMSKTHPPVFENQKIKSGYLSLCPVGFKSKYRAYILVEGVTETVSL